MSYHQITSEERYRLSALRRQGLGNPQIAQQLGRHRSTIWREVRRNAHPTDGRYKVEKAIERASGRRIVISNALYRKWPRRPQWWAARVAGEIPRRSHAGGLRAVIFCSGARDIDSGAATPARPARVEASTSMWVAGYRNFHFTAAARAAAAHAACRRQIPAGGHVAPVPLVIEISAGKTLTKWFAQQRIR